MSNRSTCIYVIYHLLMFRDLYSGLLSNPQVIFRAGSRVSFRGAPLSDCCHSWNLFANMHITIILYVTPSKSFKITFCHNVIGVLEIEFMPTYICTIIHDFFLPSLYHNLIVTVQGIASYKVLSLDSKREGREM